jgi:hypothetical protein
VLPVVFPAYDGRCGLSWADDGERVLEAAAFGGELLGDEELPDHVDRGARATEGKRLKVESAEDNLYRTFCLIGHGMQYYGFP